MTMMRSRLLLAAFGLLLLADRQPPRPPRQERSWMSTATNCMSGCPARRNPVCHRRVRKRARLPHRLLVLRAIRYCGNDADRRLRARRHRRLRARSGTSLDQADRGGAARAAGEARRAAAIRARRPFLGGPIIHSFAATYPKEIAGLVYVDPSDFTQTEADILALWEKAGAKDGREGLRKMQEQIMASAPAGVKAEFRELDRMERGGFVELRAAGDPPDVPVVFLVAGKPQPLPPTATFPGDYDRYFQANLEQRLDHFSKLAQRASKGTLVHTSKSGHFIHSTEPELVVWAIQRVLSSSATHPELERFVGEYILAPKVSMMITRDGDKIFGQLTGQPAFLLYAESATKFSLKVVNAQIEFEVDAAGNVTGLVLAQNGRRLPGIEEEVNGSFDCFDIA